MRSYLINLDRRPDRLEAMNRRALELQLTFRRVAAVDAQTAPAATINRWFLPAGPLGEIPPGDKACLLSHRAAWELFFASGEAHAAFLEDDMHLAPAAAALLSGGAWIPPTAAVVKLEHFGPACQRVLLCDIHSFRSAGKDFGLGRMLSRHTGAGAYILSRQAASLLLAEPSFDLPVDHLLFNPNNSRVFARLAPWQLLPAIARQLGGKSDIEGTRTALRALSGAYLRRELVRLGYELKLLPRQVGALARGAKFVAIGVSD